MLKNNALHCCPFFKERERSGLDFRKSRVHCSGDNLLRFLLHMLIACVAENKKQLIIIIIFSSWILKNIIITVIIAFVAVMYRRKISKSDLNWIYSKMSYKITYIKCSCMVMLYFKIDTKNFVFIRNTFWEKMTLMLQCINA